MQPQAGREVPKESQSYLDAEMERGRKTRVGFKYRDGHGGFVCAAALETRLPSPFFTQYSRVGA
jgi:hypothetical protein